MANRRVGNMKAFPQDHPIWRILNLLVTFAGATVILWICATEFDSSEWKAIGGIVVAAGGWEAAKQFFFIPKAKVDREEE